MKAKTKIFWIPIWFALGFILFNYILIGTTEKVLTPQAEEVYQQNTLQLLMASSLLLFPNFFLSFLLWTYMKNSKPSNKQLYILCFSSIGVGFLMQISIYIAYYTLWYDTGSTIPVVMFGFPFVYLFGVLIGWVIGLWIAAMSTPPKDKE
jgi:hypothetical protein